jgi:hypothetical protein
MTTTGASPSRVRRWWIVGAVLSVVVVPAVTAVVVVMAPKRTGQPVAVPPLGLPAQELLTSSMRKEPVPGWKTSSEMLGFPPGTIPKVIGNIGNNGYFLGITGTGWWLVGVDVSTGQRSFPPVELGRSDHALAFNCFVNGPTMVLCLRQDRDPAKPARAWVVDTGRGAMMFDGPSDLRLSTMQNHPLVEQRGNYAVATVNGEGVHGIGARGEPTWFVPGSGIIAQEKDWDHDVAPQPLAVQGGPNSSTTDVVFSVADGKVVKPEVPQGGRFGLAFVYPGGFGYEYSATGEYFSDQVAFFDDSGRELSRPNFKATILTGSRGIPMVQTPSADVVLTLEGRKLLELPKSTAMPYTRPIGERLFIETGGERESSWRQYDLRTGASGKTCDIEGLGYYYIASDGAVAVLIGDSDAARGFDLTTCDELWSLPGSTQSQTKEVWTVNTTLIQRTNDELFSTRLVSGFVRAPKETAHKSRWGVRRRA